MGKPEAQVDWECYFLTHKSFVRGAVLMPKSRSASAGGYSTLGNKFIIAVACFVSGN